MTEVSAPAAPSRPAFPKPSGASQRLLHTRLTPSPISSPTRPQHPPKPPDTRPVSPVDTPKELTRATAPTTPRRARTSDESVEAMLPSPSGFIYVQRSAAEPHALEVSPERVVTAAARGGGSGGSASRGERLTLSYRGVLRHCDDPDNHELTPLQDFVRECEVLKSIQQIPVFGQYLLWKPLRVWKHAVTRQRFLGRRKLVQSRLLLLLPDDHNMCIRRILLACAAKCVAFPDEQRAVGVVHEPCEISEFVQAQQRELDAFAAAKRAAEDDMAAIIRSEAVVGVRRLLDRMNVECSVELAVECCNLTISEQLARRSSSDRVDSARSCGSHPSPSPTPPQAYVVQSIFTGKLVGPQAQQEQRRQHQQREARGSHRRRRGQSHDFLIKQAQRESQEQYRRGLLAFAERAQLKMFGEQLKRAVRAVDLMWAEALRSSVVLSLNAVLGRIHSNDRATEAAALKLHVCMARNQAEPGEAGTESFAAALVPARDEFLATLNEWMARVVDASQHTNPLTGRSELKTLLAMSSQSEADPRDLARLEKLQLGGVGQLEQFASDIMQTLTAQYAEATSSSSVQLSRVSAEHGQTKQLEANITVDILSRLTVQQTAEMLDRLERLNTEYASIPRLMRCGCLQLLCHRFVEEIAHSNQTCKAKMQQTLPALFQNRHRTAMAGYQTAQEFIAIKPTDPASYVLLTIRFREVSSSRWPVLNEEFEYAVELAELLKERRVAGTDDRTMQLVVLDGAKLALQDSMQATENLLETQAQHVVAQLNAGAEALAVLIEEIQIVLDSRELASPETAAASALTVLDLQASRLADVKERGAEIAWSLQMLGAPALETTRLDDCGTLLALLRSTWELRHQINELLNEFMASAQNSVDLAQCATVVADVQAQAAHLRAELEARQGHDNAVLEAVLSDCANISRLLGVLETLRRADFWDLDARCHSEPPCKYVFANPSLSVKTLVELEIPAHVHEIVTQFPLPYE